jgi:cytochrome c6
MKGKLIVIASFLLAASAVGWSADDGAALYKKKCAACHGATGEGKPAVKAPSLQGTSWEIDKIIEHITKGEASSNPPHKKGISGLTEEQAKAIAEYVKSLK